MKRLLIALALAPGCFLAYDDGGGDAKLLPGRAPLVRTADAGDGCVNIEAGLDGDRDGVLADDEVSEVVRTICDGADAVTSPATLVEITPLDAAPCENGGYSIVVGADANGDGTLGVAERDGDPRAVCNAGTPALPVIDVVDADATTCANGGRTVRISVDGDEIFSASVCNGEAGANGSDGAEAGTPLINSSEIAPGALCQAGGRAVAAGIDDNGDSALGADEIDLSITVCDGRDATGGSGVPAGGRDEGTAAAPIDVDIGRFDGSDVRRLSSVGADGTSFYRFTAGRAGPYTIGIHGASAPVDVSAAGGDAFCTGRAGAIACSTGAVAADVEVDVQISSTGLPVSFFLTISFGGSGSAGIIEVVDVEQGVSVRGGGIVELNFTSAAADVHTIEARNLSSDGAPTIVAEMVADNLRRRTCTLPCATPALGPGSTMLVTLREIGGDGALFDLHIEPGDRVTPPLALGERAILPNGRHTFAFVAGESAVHTVMAVAEGDFQAGVIHIFEDLALRDAFLETNDLALPLARCDNYGCAAALTPSATYYTMIEPQVLGRDVAIEAHARGGTDVDVPVDLGGPFFGSHGVGSATYTFTAPREGVYTIRATTNPFLFIICGEEASDADDTFDIGSCTGTTKRLDASETTTFFIVTEGRDAVFSFTIEEGDTQHAVVRRGAAPVTFTWDADETFVDDAFYVLLDPDAAGTPSRLSIRNVVGNPFMFAENGTPAEGDFPRHQCGTLDCELSLITRADAYLKVDGADTSGSIDVEMTALPFDTLTPNTSIDNEQLPVKQVAFYRVTAAAAGTHTMRITNRGPSARQINFIVYDGIGNSLGGRSNLALTPNVPFDFSLDVLAVGDVRQLEIIEDDFFFVTYDLVVIGP